jgi:tRNA G18 (ribose-2'-O)-methylase SpoU
MISRSKFLKYSPAQKIYKIANFIRECENNISNGIEPDLLILKKYLEFLKEENTDIDEITKTILLIEKLLNDFSPTKTGQQKIQLLNICFYDLMHIIGKSVNEDDFINHKIKLFDLKKDKKVFDIIMILDNIRSPFNVGSMFRSSDCFGIKELILCGITPCPPLVKIEKTSMGTINYVDWKYFENTLDAIIKYKNSGYKIYALETSENSISLHDLKDHEKIVFIFGNEEFGITKEILEQCDSVIEIPLMGIKNSINVANTFAIVSYEIMCKNIYKL